MSEIRGFLEHCLCQDEIIPYSSDDIFYELVSLENDREQKEAIKEIIDLWTVRKIRGFDALEEIREILDRDGK